MSPTVFKAQLQGITNHLMSNPHFPFMREGWWREEAHNPFSLVYPSYSKGKDIVFPFAPLIAAAVAQPHLH